MPKQNWFERSLRLGLQRDPASAPLPLAPAAGGGDGAKLRASPAPPAPWWRRLLRLLKRPAEFVRGYVQAPMQHRANLLASDLAQVLALSEELRIRTTALQVEVAGLAASSAHHAEAAADRSEAAAAAAQAAKRLAERSREDLRRLRLLLQQQEARFVTLEALARDQETRSAAQDDRFAALEALARDQELRTSGVLARLDELDARIQLVEGRANLVAQTMGPRFDELEIKVRPLIDYDPESSAVRLADGYVMISRHDPVVLTMLADAGSGGFEPGLRQVLRRLLQPGMTAVDVGANIGLLTLACARAVGPSGMVHAFEPEPGPRAQLQKTVLQNGLAWVRIHEAALGRPGQAGRLHVSRILGHSSLYALPDAEETDAIEVPILALDEVLAGAPADVVKIDVEGAELDVLAGMSATLARNPDIAVAAEYGPSHLERVGVSPEDWFAAFDAHGFVAYAVDEPTGACRLLDAAGRSALQEIMSTNLVFIRPGGAAEGRLAS